MNNYVYLYGMILMTNSYLLKCEFPNADTYAEIDKSYYLPGGETGCCALVLASLGLNIKIDGNHVGEKVYSNLQKFFEKLTIDTSRITLNKKFNGIEDMVIIGKNTRTCFGRFVEFFSNENERKWNKPNIEDLKNAKVVGLDPFFFEQSVEVSNYCKILGKKYVTIDCKYNSKIHANAEVNILSNEFIKNNYNHTDDIEELFLKYTKNTKGLVIFTFGSKEILYGRYGEKINKFKPYKVDTVSTLGAGDSFKAGVIYALYKGMSDKEILSFAAATAATACRDFPIPLNPPTLKKIEQIKLPR